MTTSKRRVSAATSPQQHWKITLLVAGVAAAVFLWPYLAIISFAAITAYLFYPVHARLVRRMPAMVSAAVTVAFALVIVAVPLALMLLVAFAQGVSFASSFASYIQTGATGSLHDEVQSVVNQVNAVIEPVSAGRLHVTVESVRQFFATTVPVLLKSLASFMVAIASSLPSLFTAVTIYLFTVIAFLAHGASILENLRTVSPFDQRMTRLYFVRTGAMIKASMWSQLLISFVLALLTAILLILVGGGPYFFFLVGLLTVLNMIPLGSAPLVYIISAVAIMAGNISGGLWVFVIYQFVICNIDNFMRPRLIPKSVRLNTALMVLSIFCGLYYFGILGLIYGPLIMILLLTTYEVYLEYRQGEVRPPEKTA